MDAPSPAPENSPDKTQPAVKQEPEKYIRTFASDMDAAKKGGTSVPPPAPVPPPKAPSVTLPVTPPVSAPSKSPEAPSQSAPPNILPTPNNPLQTYSGDFSERMKDTHASAATILAAEQDRKERPFSVTVEESSSKSNLVYGAAGVLLIVASIAGGYLAYRHYQASTPVAPTVQISAPIFVDEREEIAGAGVELLQAVTSSVNRPLPAGTVRLLYTADSMDSNVVFSALPISVPEVLARNISPARSMAGVINVGGTQSPFFILSVSSYSNVFSGMLGWEPLLPGALADLFPPHLVAAAVATSTTATTTAKNTPRTATTTPAASPPAVTFADLAVANHDVRIYRDDSGREVLLYGFWNRTTLVIARDTAAFVEIATRLATAPAQ